MTATGRLLAVLVLVRIAWPGPRAAGAADGRVPEGQVTSLQAVSIAARWFDPAEAEAIITALHGAVVKPMPGKPLAPSPAESWTLSPGRARLRVRPPQQLILEKVMHASLIEPAVLSGWGHGSQNRRSVSSPARRGRRPTRTSGSRLGRERRRGASAMRHRRALFLTALAENHSFSVTKSNSVPWTLRWVSYLDRLFQETPYPPTAKKGQNYWQFCSTFRRHPNEAEKLHIVSDGFEEWFEQYQKTEIFTRLKCMYARGYHDGSPDNQFGFKSQGHWENDFRWRQTAKNIIDHLHPQPDTVLEVGAGRGSLIKQFSEMGKHVYGIDISEYCVDNPIPGAEGMLDVGIVCGLPFDEKEVDVVIALDVLEHQPIDYFDLAMREICRVARTQIFITVPNEMVNPYLKGSEVELEHYIVQRWTWWVEQFKRFGFKWIPFTGPKRNEFPFNMGNGNFPLLFSRGGYAESHSAVTE